LLAPYEIQGCKTCGLDAVYHVVDHFGLPFGQIAYITKNLTAMDLGFYKELNKTGRAS
jgi:polyferredoxin